MISATSRYQTATINTVEASDGTRQEMRVPFPRSRVASFTYYAVRAGDRVDTLSHYFLGDASLWWMLADVNPEILDWLDLNVGDVLRIPNV